MRILYGLVIVDIHFVRGNKNVWYQRDLEWKGLRNFTLYRFLRHKVQSCWPGKRTWKRLVFWVSLDMNTYMSIRTSGQQISANPCCNVHLVLDACFRLSRHFIHPHPWISFFCSLSCLFCNCRLQETISWWQIWQAWCPLFCFSFEVFSMEIDEELCA